MTPPGTQLDAGIPAPQANMPDAGSVPSSQPDARVPDAMVPTTPAPDAMVSKPDAGVSTPDAASQPPAGTIVAIGSNGLRTVSRDRGLTWVDPQSQAGGGATELQGITWGGGRFVAVGGSASYTSTDGSSWQRHPHALGWLQAVAFGHGRYVAVGGGYLAAWSPDGQTWTLGEPVAYGGGDYNINTVVFDGQDFYATGVDGGQVSSNPVRWRYWIYKTRDAEARGKNPDGTNPTWTRLNQVLSGAPDVPSIEICGGQVKPTIECGSTPFRGLGIWLRGEYPRKIARSTDGQSFSVVATVSEGIRAFAFGPP